MTLSSLDEVGEGHWSEVTEGIHKRRNICGYACTLYTRNSVQLCQQLLPTNSITAAPSILRFQLISIADQPHIRANETKRNANVLLTLTLTLTLIVTLILFTLLTPRCNMIGRSVAAILFIIYYISRTQSTHKNEKQK